MKQLHHTTGRALVIAAAATFMYSGCHKAPSPSTSDTLALPETEDFHADNDIAMTILSLADAIKVGEPLDSAQYDFEGVLTDGQGSPLYTDVQGAPGLWQVDVIDNRSAVIRNIFLGDLLPSDLQSYLLRSLGLGDDNRMAFTSEDSENNDETEIMVYDFGGGFLRFEVRAGVAPNGLEGQLLNIIMSADPPTGAS